MVTVEECNQSCVEAQVIAADTFGPFHSSVCMVPWGSPEVQGKCTEKLPQNILAVSNVVSLCVE